MVNPHLLNFASRCHQDGQSSGCKQRWELWSWFPHGCQMQLTKVILTGEDWGLGIASLGQEAVSPVA